MDSGFFLVFSLAAYVESDGMVVADLHDEKVPGVSRQGRFHRHPCEGVGAAVRFPEKEKLLRQVQVEFAVGVALQLHPVVRDGKAGWRDVHVSGLHAKQLVPHDHDVGRALAGVHDEAKFVVGMSFLPEPGGDAGFKEPVGERPGDLVGVLTRAPGEAAGCQQKGECGEEKPGQRVHPAYLDEVCSRMSACSTIPNSLSCLTISTLSPMDRPPFCKIDP